MLVLFRGQHGRLHCLADECPHRAAPLSSGRIELVDGHACVVSHTIAQPASQNQLAAWTFQNSCTLQEGTVFGSVEEHLLSILPAVALASQESVKVMPLMLHRDRNF